jgi:uncharacterized RDD family membrane protein YckC
MEIRYPDLKTRIQSVLIDTLFMVVLMFVAAWLFDKAGIGGGENEGWIKAITFIGIWGVYEPLSTTLGCTAGNYLMDIRVRQHDNTGQKINILQAYLRFGIKFFLGWVSFLTIHTNKQRRAIHDLAAGSVMIEK